MRLLLVEPDARLRSRIRRHVRVRWPDALFTSHPPETAGALPPEFLAQGFDAVLLGQAWPGGDGLAWLQDLSSRRGFAPVIFLVEREDSESARLGREAGAFAVVTPAQFGDRLLTVLHEASILRQRTLADWRLSEAGQAARYFGGVKIPGYRCIRRIASGPASQLFMAESEKFGDIVAIKLRPSLQDDEGNDASFQRFLQEYEIGRELHHPNLVYSHELGITDEHAYLVMEYFPRGDLRRRMQEGLDAESALAIGIQIARGLRALHGAGTLHRDLKPGNVLMRSRHRVALSDFGLAKRLDQVLELTGPGILFGTPQYMSPEQAHGEPVGVQSDLYSLGVVLFEMLAGHRPFEDASPMTVLYLHRNAPIPALPDQHRLLQPLVDRLLAKQPAQRFASAEEAERAMYAAMLQYKGIAA